MLDRVHMNAPTFGAHSASDEADTTVLRQIQDFLFRRWFVVACTVCIVQLGTVLLLRVMTPHYAAHAEVLLDPRRDKVFGPDDSEPTVNLDTSSVENAVALIKANTLLGHVVDAEHLAVDPEFNGSGVAQSLLGNWLGLLLRKSKATQTNPARYALGSLYRNLRVERVSKAYVLSIIVTAKDPAKAARLANAVAEAFVQDQRAAHLEASRRAAVFFAERLPPLGDQLRRSEEALEAFRREHGLLARSASGTGNDGQPTINEQQVSELNTKLVAARAETAGAWARYDQARSVEKGGGSKEAIPDVLRSNLIAQLRQQQAEVARKEADLAARYNGSHPLLIDVRAERRDIEGSISREMNRILTNLKGAYDIAKAQEDGLRASVALMTGAAGLDSDLGLRLRELERVRLVDQTVFEAYLARAKGAEQQANFEEHDIRVISQAHEPVVQSFPQTSLVLFLATIFGLGLGTGIGALLDRLNPGFLTPRQTESALGLPVLAAIPWLKAKDRMVDGKAVDPPRYLASRPQSRFAEAVHAVRAGIRLSGGRPAKIVLVTSSIPGEGKSTVALSLGLSAARAGHRVLLLDADLRQPTMSRYCGIENRLGLVDMLSGLVGTEETTVPLGAGLSIMPGGRRSAAAPDLFASVRMAHYVDHLRAIYDLVFIDAAPVESVIDSRVLAELSDRIVFVVGWQQTHRDLVRHSLLALSHPEKIAGLVLNKIDERKVPRHGPNAHHPSPAYQHYVEV